ncbi:hypothetical protein BH09BAC5_BH09BAC5_14380 [soil metagenome]
MFVLSEQQVSFILNDIRRNGIELEELQLNLLDHICCIIENEMPPDRNFEEFYRSIIPRFFKKELREIQEETELLLTFKNYYAMKKVMIISGGFSAIAIVAGSFFKIMHWPGASALFVLAVATMCFLFLPLVFLLKAKEIKVKRDKIILSIATLFGIIFSFGVLFKVMHWPGASIMWLTSLAILFFLFLPIYFFGGIRNPETKTNTIITSILILGAVGLLFLLTNLRPSVKVDYLRYSASQQLSASYAYASAENKITYSNLESDTTKSKTDFTELRNSCNSLCDKIEAQKNKINDFICEGQDPKPGYEQLFYEYASNYDVPNNLLFDHLGVPSPELISIKQDLEKLKNILKEKYNKNNLSMIDTSDSSPYGNPAEGKVAWEKAKFFHVPYELVMNNFTQLQLDIRMIESSCL